MKTQKYSKLKSNSAPTWQLGLKKVKRIAGRKLPQRWAYLAVLRNLEPYNTQKY